MTFVRSLYLQQFSLLKTEAEFFSKTSVNIHQTARFTSKKTMAFRNIPNGSKGNESQPLGAAIDLQ
jgi:hypothetical protein